MAVAGGGNRPIGELCTSSTPGSAFDSRDDNVQALLYTVAFVRSYALQSHAIPVHFFPMLEAYVYPGTNPWPDGVWKTPSMLASVLCKENLDTLLRKK